MEWIWRSQHWIQRLYSFPHLFLKGWTGIIQLLRAVQRVLAVQASPAPAQPSLQAQERPNLPVPQLQSHPALGQKSLAAPVKSRWVNLINREIWRLEAKRWEGFRSSEKCQKKCFLSAGKIPVNTPMNFGFGVVVFHHSDRFRFLDCVNHNPSDGFIFDCAQRLLSV